MPRRRRFHLDLPHVTAMTSGHRMTFVGVTFHSRSVMIEYDALPIVDRRSNRFGPLLIGLVVTDDTADDPYPTAWEDFDWSFEQPGRLTTRLDRRPPLEATRLDVSVRSLTSVQGPGEFSQQVASEHELVAFTVRLPSDHAAAPPARPQTDLG